MKPIWFIHQGGSVTGPHSEVEVERRLGSGTLTPEVLIWARGANEWQPISEWKTLQAKIAAIANANTGRVWYCDSGSGQPAGPLTEAELIDHLKGFSRLESMLLWGSGLEKWTPLFEVADVMDLIGISRRESPRVPLLGQVAVTQIGSSSPAQVLQTATVSNGGIGVKLAGFLTPGDRVQLVIRSRDFGSILHVTGRVLYVSRTGDAGIKFDETSAELRSVLHDHIRRFNSNERAAAA